MIIEMAANINYCKKKIVICLFSEGKNIIHVHAQYIHIEVSDGNFI